jgi:hypothetical protein
VRLEQRPETPETIAVPGHLGMDAGVRDDQCTRMLDRVVSSRRLVSVDARSATTVSALVGAGLH